MFRLTSLATALLSLFMLSAPASAYEAITGPLGLLAYDKAKAYDGYTLFTPHTKVSSWIVDKIQDPGSRKTYLIDMEGNIVHTWKHDRPAFYAELLPNGNLLRAEKIAGSPVNFGGLLRRGRGAHPHLQRHRSGQRHPLCPPLQGAH